MQKVTQRSIMTKLIDALELKVLMSPTNSTTTTVDGGELLILVEYARQLEAVINSIDQDPKKANHLIQR